MVDGVAVVLVGEEDSRDDDLAARVPLGREEKGEALSGVGDEAGGVGGLVGLLLFSGGGGGMEGGR